MSNKNLSCFAFKHQIGDGQQQKTCTKSSKPIDKGKTDIEMKKDEPESTKQMKNVKFADQSDTAIIEVITQNEIPKNIQEKSIKTEADEYTDFHLDDLIE